MNVEHGKRHVVVDEAKRQYKKKLERNVSSAVASYLETLSGLRQVWFVVGRQGSCPGVASGFDIIDTGTSRA
jgi:hypothetical protein